MRLRTQLILLVFLLGVLPLGGIVSFTYFTSLSAFRRAAEAEAAGLTAEMGQRLEASAQELSRRVAALSRLPFGEITSEEQARRQGLHRQLVEEMGELAPLVEAIEFIPAPPEPGEAPEAGIPAPEVTAAEAAATEAGAPESRVPRPLRFELSPARSTIAEATREALAEVEEELGQAELGREGEAGLRLAQGLLQGILAGVETEAPPPQSAPDEPAGGEGEGAPPAGLAAAGGKLAELMEQRLAEDEGSRAAAMALAEGWRGLQTVLGHELVSPVRRDGQVVGHVGAVVRRDALIAEALRETPRGQGEIPFAVDADGEKHFAHPADGPALAAVPLPAGDFAGQVTSREAGDSWIVVSRREPEAGVTLGIARPIREPLAGIQRTAARNFGYGVGVLGLCLLGILPLSRRVTRSLDDLTRGAERLAQGQLDTRVPVRSRGELGRLAQAFNRMSQQLREHREQLLAEERWRRDQEIRERLLEAENERRGQELDEARRFQLSLLPRQLPRREDLEVAVSMKTAAEVGGDYYDFHAAEDGTLTVAIGDATGHGARAGTMVTVVKTLFTTGAASADMVGFLGEAAAAIRRMELGRMAMALQLVRLHRSILTVTSAGMPPVLIHRRAAREVEELALEGVPLGGLDRAAYSAREVELAPGDTVLLMTDGFPELLDRRGEPLGYERARAHFGAVAERDSQGIVAGLEAAALAWSGDERPADDVTFVVLKLKG